MKTLYTLLVGLFLFSSIGMTLAQGIFLEIPGYTENGGVVGTLTRNQVLLTSIQYGFGTSTLPK